MSLDQSTFENADASAIAGAKELRHLSLSHCQINDAGVVDLGAHPVLRGLVLTGCPITDESIGSIAEQFPGLAALFLHSTQITDAGAERLRGLLPKCKVHHSAGHVEPPSTVAGRRRWEPN